MTLAEIDALLAKLRGVTEDDAYALPWTFGETCRSAADALDRLRALLAAETERAEKIRVAAENFERCASAEIEDSNADIARLNAALAEREAEVARLTAENEQREAWNREHADLRRIERGIIRMACGETLMFSTRNAINGASGAPITMEMLVAKRREILGGFEAERIAALTEKEPRDAS
ncbi:hypothetical protein [Amaricoccus solimangrovi]|uniref:Uncharacterized protein n=1 Tax=Amaricoccus solimangrovi TaxID=2589815 RepID=A0A501WUF1_9RHOB|nr:hypothetical protein [Amaricoccus solimangrovi]TPE53048.1 hypothetical protein FJM51_03210 [Amaricoccus solimangrovi]